MWSPNNQQGKLVVQGFVCSSLAHKKEEWTPSILISILCLIWSSLAYHPHHWPSHTRKWLQRLLECGLKSSLQVIHLVLLLVQPLTLGCQMCQRCEDIQVPKRSRCCSWWCYCSAKFNTAQEWLLIIIIHTIIVLVHHCFACVTKKKRKGNHQRWVLSNGRISRVHLVLYTFKFGYILRWDVLRKPIIGYLHFQKSPNPPQHFCGFHKTSCDSMMAMNFSEFLNTSAKQKDLGIDCAAAGFGHQSF